MRDHTDTCSLHSPTPAVTLRMTYEKQTSHSSMRRGPLTEAVAGLRRIRITPWRQRQPKTARNGADNWEGGETKQQAQHQRVVAQEPHVRYHHGTSESQEEMPLDEGKREKRFGAGVVKCIKVVAITPFVALYGVVFVTGSVIYGAGMVLKEVGSYATAGVWEEDFNETARSKKSSAMDRKLK